MSRPQSRQSPANYAVIWLWSWLISHDHTQGACCLSSPVRPACLPAHTHMRLVGTQLAPASSRAYAAPAACLQDSPNAIALSSDDSPNGHDLELNHVYFSYRDDQPILKVRTLHLQSYGLCYMADQ